MHGSAVGDRNEAVAVIGAFLVDGPGGYGDLAKPAPRATGVVRIDPAHSPECFGSDLEGFTAILGLAG
jgi:hypothetical protein